MLPVPESRGKATAACSVPPEVRSWVGKAVTETPSEQSKMALKASLPQRPQTPVSLSKAWPRASTGWVTVSPQTVQVKVLTPSSVQVGWVVTTPSSQVWPSMQGSGSPVGAVKLVR